MSYPLLGSADCCWRIDAGPVGMSPFALPARGPVGGCLVPFASGAGDAEVSGCAWPFDCPFCCCCDTSFSLFSSASRSLSFLLRNLGFAAAASAAFFFAKSSSTESGCAFGALPHPSLRFFATGSGALAVASSDGGGGGGTSDDGGGGGTSSEGGGGGGANSASGGGGGGASIAGGCEYQVGELIRESKRCCFRAGPIRELWGWLQARLI